MRDHELELGIVLQRGKNAGPRGLACKPSEKDELKDRLKVEIVDFAQ